MFYQNYSFLQSSEETFLQDYLKFGKRFIEFIGKVKPGEQWKLLHLYLTHIAKVRQELMFVQCS